MWQNCTLRCCVPYDHFLINVSVFLDHGVKCFSGAATEQNDVTSLGRNTVHRGSGGTRTAKATVSLFSGGVLLPRKERRVRRGRWGVDDTSEVVAFLSVTAEALRLAAAAGGAGAFVRVACEIRLFLTQWPQDVRQL